LEGRHEPVRASAMTPAAIHHRPRSSRQPCHTSQAPPISASAASTNSATDLTAS
jgi:hypothetical protein